MLNKLTTEIFLSKLDLEKYDYSITNYINKVSYIEYICRIHGVIKQLPANHLKIGCPYCSRKSHNTFSFVNEAKRIHGNKYDYSITEYLNNKTNIKFTCYKCGTVEQTAKSHLKSGCLICANYGNEKYTKESFISKANEVHKFKYDYSKVIWKNTHEKIIVKCHEHGEFSILPYAHINQKQGCRICGYKNRNNNKKTTEIVKKEFNDKWGIKYNYDEVEYIDKYTKVKIYCNECKKYIYQIPYLHFKNGCYYCNNRGESKHTKESFINKSNEIHDNKYDYSKVEFINIQDKVTITCLKHGNFEQHAYSHFISGCPKCNSENYLSKGEIELFNFIKSIYNGEINQRNKKVLQGKEIDIFIPEYNIGIEYNGLWYHREDCVGKHYHDLKYKIAKGNNIKLYQFWDYEWKNKNDIVKSMIKNSLNLNDRIYARKTKVIELKDCNKFIEENHIQGIGRYVNGPKFGLEYNGQIIACMVFCKSRFTSKYKWELYRFCSLKGLNVVGGASKLLSYFNEGNIVSYANKRYSNGNLYEKLGFSLKNEMLDYFYFKNNTIINRLKAQKHKLHKILDEYSPNLSEVENMKINGYNRVYGAGILTYIKK